VVEKNVVAAELTGDGAPATAEYLKLLLSFDAEADAEALEDSKSVVRVLNRPIATDDNDLRSASPVGFQEAATGRRFPSCIRSVTLARHQRSSPMIRFPFVSLASHTRHLAPSEVAKLKGLDWSW
jgi:hypothetical protein